jgi:molybdopterin converting factor small subunit
MQIKLIIFGQLADILGESLVLENIADTDSLTAALNKKHPALVNATYVIAVNKKIVTGNSVLTDDSTVALLPPFSGG